MSGVTWDRDRARDAGFAGHGRFSRDRAPACVSSYFHVCLLIFKYSLKLKSFVIGPVEHTILNEMYPFTALGSIQADGETARVTAEMFLRRVLRVGCSLTHSLVEAANELNIDLSEFKVGKKPLVQQSIDRIVQRSIPLPITVHNLKLYLTKKIPMASMIQKFVIDKHRKLGSWVRLCINCYCMQYIYICISV